MIKCTLSLKEWLAGQPELATLAEVQLLLDAV
jgi:hypothetical protein